MITMAITIAFRNVINEDQRLSIIMTIGWQLPSFTIDLITIVSHHFSIGFASQANPRDPGSLILQIHRPEHTSTHTHTCSQGYIIYIYIYLFIYLYLYLYMCTLIPSYPQAAWFAVLLFDTVVVGLGWGGLGLGEWGFGGVGGGAITFQEAASWAIAGGLAIDWCCGCYVDAGSLQLVATLMFPCYVFRMGLICWC